jgi:hypothetical protein
MSFIEGVVVGLAVGVFAPGVARQVKALWVKYTQKVVPVIEDAVKNEIKK